MKNKMNKLMIFTLLIIFVNSCTQDNILDLKPINNISVDDAFSTPSLIASSVNGMYNAAAIGQYNSTVFNSGRGYVWGAAFVQQGDNRGEDVVNTATFYQLTYTNTYDPTTANNVYYWVDGYRLINRANLLIEGVTKAVANGIITAEVGDDYIGQAKFFRAITHFEMANHFARPYNDTPNGAHEGIPYREVGVDTQGEVDEVLKQGRNTVGEVYAKALADLDDAEKTIKNKDITKATANAAIAFKVRINLHKRDWANVISEGKKLEGVFELGSHPGNVFLNAYNNKESIFSMAHTAIINPGVNAALASQYKRRLLVCISPIIWNDPEWLVDDKRRYDNDADPLAMVFTSSGRKYTNKYKDVVSYTDPAPVIRYAEILLNMAEAYARTNDMPNALKNLNLVRDRSLADPATQSYTSFADAKAVLGAILKERRIEFLMEGRRWGDIHRLQNDDLFPISGVPAKVANGNPKATDFNAGVPYAGALGVSALAKDDYRVIWPIPQIELNANPNLSQNPGYN